ncbi:MAG TPA: LacI family transcriptional regulator [Candidatus Blautia stercoripullorum]|uniref:LacI family transcriptional regulator n=1 Tax=Candidatus Blautia stercoripullorum TaxID=2838502 RepID=A0A9D2U5S5_9FIRM|nr:LacI family transcriptional regulator [Candidatus Blautia stercoripullorum]
MITIKEIAKQLGVSPTTVSNVINGRTEKMSEQTRMRIEEMLIKNHYVQENRGGRGGQDELKLVIVEFFFGIREHIYTDPFCAELLEAIEKELEKTGRNVVCSTVYSEEEFLKKLSAHNVEGSIILGCDPERCEPLCKRTAKPLVFVDCGEGNYDNIGLQDREGARELTSYLIKQGHRKIAFFCDQENPIASNKSRLQGYREALEKHGIPYYKENFYYLPPEKNLRYEVLRRFARTAKEKGYTAAFFVADLYANEAVNVFFSKNLWVPEDISVVGFDDNVYARLSRPTLTTVRQSPTDKGREAVSLLLKRVYGQEVMVGSMELPTELIVRESVRNIWKHQNVV